MKKMDARKFTLLHVSIFLLLCTLIAGCAPAPSPTPYIPPTPVKTTIPAATPTFTYPSAPVSTLVCVSDLDFLDDITIPDNTYVEPGSMLDKQWLVQNIGSCDWNSGYRLKFIGGALMGASAEQALVPARAGKEATIRILFTAPLEAGQYVSLWQAYDPAGMPFGEVFQVTVVVQP